MKLEIQTEGVWYEVNSLTFEAHIGPRRLNGSIYHGPVYYLGTDRVRVPFQEPKLSRDVGNSG